MEFDIQKLTDDEIVLLSEIGLAFLSLSEDFQVYEASDGGWIVELETREWDNVRRFSKANTKEEALIQAVKEFLV